MDIISYAIGKKKGGVQPTGEIEITQNGITNVSGYATANVQVPQPSGKITITQNGTDIDVSSYASADVSVGGDLVAPSSISFSEMTMETFTAENNIDFTNLKSIPTFQFCNNLQSVNCNAWKTTKSLSFSYMFYGCSSLKTVNFSEWERINANNLYAMFSGCSSLERIDLSNLYNDGGRTINTLFVNDNNLTYVDMSNFDFTTITNTTNAFAGVPTNCLIYVKDQSQVDWFTTNFPELTNVQIKS